jgi:hypothetical protein
VKSQKLTPNCASWVSFATALDAFTYDWHQHFAAAGVAVAAAAPPAQAAAQIVPRALASVVAFYVTNRAFTPDPTAVPFADQLIAEPLPGAPVADPVADPALMALLADVRAAALAEDLTAFHAAANPVVPASAESLEVRLASLSQEGVLAALIVDPAIWPGAATPAAEVINQIVRSHKWAGPVLCPILEVGPVEADQFLQRFNLPEWVVALPLESEPRIAALRPVFVRARGRAMRASTRHEPTAERVPLLRAERE